MREEEMGKMKRVRFWPGKGKENTKRENQVRNSGKRKKQSMTCTNTIKNPNIHNPLKED